MDSYNYCRPNNAIADARVIGNCLCVQKSARLMNNKRTNYFQSAIKSMALWVRCIRPDHDEIDSKLKDWTSRYKVEGKSNSKLVYNDELFQFTNAPWARSMENIDGSSQRHSSGTMCGASLVHSISSTWILINRFDAASVFCFSGAPANRWLIEADWYRWADQKSHSPRSTMRVPLLDLDVAHIFGIDHSRDENQNFNWQICAAAVAYRHSSGQCRPKCECVRSRITIRKRLQTQNAWFVRRLVGNVEKP